MSSSLPPESLGASLTQQQQQEQQHPLAAFEHDAEDAAISALITPSHIVRQLIHRVTCPLCQMTLISPVQTPCQHVFCKPCLARALAPTIENPRLRALLYVTKEFFAENGQGRDPLLLHYIFGYKYVEKVSGARRARRDVDKLTKSKKQNASSSSGSSSSSSSSGDDDEHDRDSKEENGGKESGSEATTASNDSLVSGEDGGTPVRASYEARLYDLIKTDEFRHWRPPRGATVDGFSLHRLVTDPLEHLRRHFGVSGATLYAKTTASRADLEELVQFSSVFSHELSLVQSYPGGIGGGGGANESSGADGGGHAVAGAGALQAASSLSTTARYNSADDYRATRDFLFVCGRRGAARDSVSASLAQRSDNTMAMMGGGSGSAASMTALGAASSVSFEQIEPRKTPAVALLDRCRGVLDFFIEEKAATEQQQQEPAAGTQERLSAFAALGGGGEAGGSRSMLTAVAAVKKSLTKARKKRREDCCPVCSTHCRIAECRPVPLLSAFADALAQQALDPSDLSSFVTALGEIVGSTGVDNPQQPAKLSQKREPESLPQPAAVADVKPSSSSSQVVASQTNKKKRSPDSQQGEQPHQQQVQTPSLSQVVPRPPSQLRANLLSARRELMSRDAERNQRNSLSNLASAAQTPRRLTPRQPAHEQLDQSAVGARSVGELRDGSGVENPLFVPAASTNSVLALGSGSVSTVQEKSSSSVVIIGSKHASSSTSVLHRSTVGQFE